MLRGTGRGGILSDGYLRDDPLESYVDDDETPVFVRSNAKKGVAYERLESGKTGRIVPCDGYRAFMLVTDERLVFVIGDNEQGSDGDCSVAVPLADIQLVDASDGLLASEVGVTTLTDVCWRFPCSGEVEDLRSYLDVATEAWKRLENHLDDARDHLLAAGRHRETRDYDAAMAALDEASDATAAARRREREFVESGVASMATRIDRAAERVRDARLETLRARATHYLDRAEQLWREDEYGDAHEVFLAAHADYVAALEIQDVDFEASAALRKRLARVERNLASLERAPVERAAKARERARETDDRAERAVLLERALERYRSALELDWGKEGKRFGGDTAELRERVDAVATELVETRRRLAATAVKEGDRHRQAGRPGRAADRYREARDVLDQTLPTARELVPDAAEPLAEHRDAVTRRLRALDVGDADDPDSTDPDAADADATDADASPGSKTVSSPSGGSVVSPT